MRLRTRLIVICLACIVLTGVSLLAVNHLLLERVFAAEASDVRRSTEGELDLAPGALAGGDFALRVGRVERANVEPSAVASEVQAQTRTQVLGSMLRWSGTMLVALALAAVGAAMVLARRFLAPIEALTSAAKRLSTESLHERIKVPGPGDEIKDLTNSFNGMLNRLEKAFVGQKRFAANASHQLKTPLSIMRAQIDVAKVDSSLDRAKKTLVALDETVNRMERLLDGLLRLAKTERELDVTHFDLAVLVTEVIEEARTRFEPDEPDFTTELQSCVIWGDRDLLHEVVDNLIDNDMAHGGARGTIVVRYDAEGWALLSVANGGKPLPAERVHDLFEPFTTLEDERVVTAGTGLGLSIVRSVVGAHGGAVEARAPMEGGLEVAVTLPAHAGRGLSFPKNDSLHKGAR